VNAYFLYGRCLLLIAAYGGVSAAIGLFSVPDKWSISQLIGEFLFSPYKLLAAATAFTIGFLAYSRFVQDVLRFQHYTTLNRIRFLLIILACLSWIHLFTKSWFVALLALILALSYGIMDVDLGKREK
jgi:hypothetical protein